MTSSRNLLEAAARDSAAPGKRARNKADKLARIRDAARGLFVENGFDGTTLRDVAARGGVGFGTLFDYASNKRDLLFLVFNPELSAALDSGHAKAVKRTDFLDQLMCLFESYYRLYGREPEIARYILRELNFYREGDQATRFMDQRTEFLRRLAELTVQAQNRAQVSVSAPPEAIAQIVLSVFAWEVRRWLSAEPLDVKAGLQRLRGLLALQLSGFATPPIADR